MKFVLRFLVAAILASSSAFLAATNTDEYEPWRLFAAIVVALPGAYIAGSGLANRLRPSEEAKSSVALALRRAILDLGEEEIAGWRVFRDHLATMSFHVWLVPIWYRRLYGFRQRVRSVAERTIGLEAVDPFFPRPKLERFVVDRVEELEPSEIHFRRGKGLVGICIERNRDRAMIVDFETSDMKAMLSCSKEDWENASEDVTHRLEHEEFKRLADRYGQAMAFVLRETTTGEPVGCLTFELPPDSEIRIQDYDAPPTPTGRPSLTPEGAVLIRKVKSTRKMVQGLVSLKQLPR